MAKRERQGRKRAGYRAAEPSPEEITAACNVIREGWPEQRKRKYDSEETPSWLPPVINAADLGASEK